MNRLRILLTNMSLSYRSGTETYVRDLAIALACAGHSPVVFSTQLGGLADELREATVPVVDDLRNVGALPDIIHGQHTLETWSALTRFPNTPAIFVCHDCKSWHDTPPVSSNIRKYIGVDQACHDRLLLKHGIEESKIAILGNSVDIVRFAVREPLPEKPRRALLYSNYAQAFHVEEIRAACNEKGIELDTIGQAIGGKTDRPETLLQNYDLVFAKGRSAMEAAATGAAVIACDARGCGPMINSSEVERQLHHNLGGRLLANPVRRDVVASEIDRYDASDAKRVCEIVRETRDLKALVEKIVGLYRETMQDFRPAPIEQLLIESSKCFTWWAENWSQLLQDYGASAVRQAFEDQAAQQKANQSKVISHRVRGNQLSKMEERLKAEKIGPINRLQPNAATESGVEFRGLIPNLPTKKYSKGEKATMDKKKVVFVVAHPAHILTVAGMVQRYQPAILVCNSSESSNAGAQAKLVRAGLKMLGIKDRPTFLEIDEPEAYGWAHAREWTPFIQIRDRIHDWIRDQSPDVVFGDAYECANYQHDVVRLMLDSALRKYRNVGNPLENYEFPLVCKMAAKPNLAQYQVFPNSEISNDKIQKFELTEDEIQRKEAIIRWAWPQSDFIAEVAPLFPPINVEPFQAIPWDRDYSQVPVGLLRHYDDRGHELVGKGVHDRPILFSQHFLPLVEALAMCPEVSLKS